MFKFSNEYFKSGSVDLSSIPVFSSILKQNANELEDILHTSPAHANTQTKDGFTPLMLAVQEVHYLNNAFVP